MENPYYKSRLRNKGQVTLPQEVRQLLSAEEGDDLLFTVDAQGHVVISRAQVIPPDQVWFWSDRWQRMEREAQADLESGRTFDFDSLEDALAALDQLEPGDAED